MGVSLNTNIMAIQAIRRLDDSITRFAASSEKLVTGLALSGTGEDPSGLAIVLGLAKDKRMAEGAKKNAMEAVALVQKAGSDLNSVQNIMLKAREIAVTAASDYISDEERDALQIEMKTLQQEARRIAEASTFGQTSILGGEGKQFNFFVGTNPKVENNIITLDTSMLDISDALDKLDSIDISDADVSIFAVEQVTEAMQSMLSQRAYAGGVQFRLNSAINQLEHEVEMKQAMIANREQVDFLKETTNYMQAMIQREAATSILAQANLQPALVLKLLEPKSPFY